ncbi:MAG: hypothetical protein LBL92_07230 [Propionibacteriaceae bacterium]|jgi:hypothetical protein|nr:hypothetical protein [Propionibacteriaceae bacterium]
MFELLRSEELPNKFVYAEEFLRVVTLRLTSLEPWWIMQGRELRERYNGLRTRYPSYVLVPFARRQDNDDVACWDVPLGKIIIVHDFASSGWERRKEFPDFYSWFRQAIDDLIEFDL